MLPVPGFREKMMVRDLPKGDQAFYFFGEQEDYEDFLGRCKYMHDAPDHRTLESNHHTK